MEWEKQSGGDLWTPKEEGEELTGEVISVDEGQYGKQWVIKKGDGKVIRTASHKVLQNRMASISIGDTVKIVAGKEDLPKIKGHNPTRLYEVFKAKK